jgi:hypothetical protein
VSALFVIVTVPVIAVGAGSARPNMVQTTDCTLSLQKIATQSHKSRKSKKKGQLKIVFLPLL